MSTESDRQRMERQDPQPGRSTFDRNHPSTWERHDPMNKRVEQREASLRLRQRAPQIEAGDKLTARLMIEAAVLLDQATFAESIWEDRARAAERRVLEVRS
ncbi:MAG: hypothetical protein RL006_943 [Chloroflexota bacterium]